jgi:hypothetical protein
MDAILGSVIVCFNIIAQSVKLRLIFWIKGITDTITEVKGFAERQMGGLLIPCIYSVLNSLSAG